jgi:hypothetical protein
LKAGFSLGRSTDSAATFEGLFRYDALCGRAGCDSSNTSRCVAEWDLVAPMLGATCPLDGGLADASVGDANAADGARGTVDREGGATPTSVGDSSGCAIGADGRRAGTWPSVFALIGVFVGRRRAHRAGRRPSCSRYR